MNLTEQVKSKAKQLGVDMVGIAPVERFTGAPLRMSPQGLLPDAKCVVVAGIHHLDAAVELGGQPTPHDTGPFDSQFAMNSRLDDISFLLGRFLEESGFKALPIAASNIWRYHGYKDLDVDFAPQPCPPLCSGGGRLGADRLERPGPYAGIWPAGEICFRRYRRGPGTYTYVRRRRPVR
ncbi:MAG: hypothetical protein SVV80_01050 [Planctomycetota bacterium]|nr:hypothetical protein [Planctomycetota bacterium]